VSSILFSGIDRNSSNTYLDRYPERCGRMWASVSTGREGLRMGMAKEFKAFALRGNVMDMAIGIVIGAAFGAIVASFVADVLMPPIGLLMGGVVFSDLAITLREATADSEAILLNYGMFLQAVMNFLIIALAIFMAVKGINSMKKKEEEAPAAPAAPGKEEVLLSEIRDLLKKN